MLLTLAEAGLENKLLCRPYEYEPLPSAKSIRILVLHSACGWNDALEGYLTTCHINEKFATSSLAYKAVSYVWGSSDLDQEILLDGRSASITRSLAQALKGLRNQGELQYVWADGICINQTDIKEKNHQVELMSAIFACASRVIAWLGVENDQYNHPLEPILTEIRHGIDLVNSSPNFSDKSIDALGSLLDRPWFRRRWIIQEIVLARRVRVHVGERYVSWEVFVHAVELLYSRRRWILENARTNIENIRAMNALHVAWQRKGHEPSRHTFVQLLVLFSTSACSDQKDQIYALLGIASERRTFFQVDYANTTAEVFAHFAHHHFFTRGWDGYQLLQCAGAFRGNSQARMNPQSWIPEWTRTPRYTPLLGNEFIAGSHSSFNDTKPSIKWTEDCLFIKGDILDSIVRKSRYCRGMLNVEQFRDILWSWIALLNETCSYQDADLLDILGITLIADSALAHRDRILQSHSLCLEQKGRWADENYRLLREFQYLLRQAIDSEDRDSDDSSGKDFDLNVKVDKSVKRLEELLNLPQRRRLLGITRTPATASQPSRQPGQISPLTRFTSKPGEAGMSENVSMVEEKTKRFSESLNPALSIKRRFGANRSLSLSRTPSGTPDRTSTPDSKRMLSGKWIDRAYFGEDWVDPEEIDAQTTPGSHEYMHLLSRTMSGRCLYRTERGRIGIGPGDIANGDIVATFRGARTPFILRKTHQLTSSYRLLGDTYTHGLMRGRGQDSQGADRPSKGKTVFEIR